MRAALLWDSIDRNDLRTLAVDLKDWAPDALRDREMWGPTAVGLDRIGRSRDAIRFFVLALLIGITSGTYSSVFNASPILVSWHEWDANRKARAAGRLARRAAS